MCSGPKYMSLVHKMCSGLINVFWSTRCVLVCTMYSGLHKCVLVHKMCSGLQNAIWFKSQGIWQASDFVVSPLIVPYWQLQFHTNGQSGRRGKGWTSVCLCVSVGRVVGGFFSELWDCSLILWSNQLRPQFPDKSQRNNTRPFRVSYFFRNWQSYVIAAVQPSIRLPTLPIRTKESVPVGRPLHSSEHLNLTPTCSYSPLFPT